MLSEGVDRREAIPIVPKASHDTGYTVYLPSMIREVTTCSGVATVPELVRADLLNHRGTRLSPWGRALALGAGRFYFA